MHVIMFCYARDLLSLTPLSLVHGKHVLHKTSPWGQKGWEPLKICLLIQYQLFSPHHYPALKRWHIETVEVNKDNLALLVEKWRSQHFLLGRTEKTLVHPSLMFRYLHADSALLSNPCCICPYQCSALKPALDTAFTEFWAVADTMYTKAERVVHYYYTAECFWITLLEPEAHNIRVYTAGWATASPLWQSICYDWGRYLLTTISMIQLELIKTILYLNKALHGDLFFNKI